MQGDTLNERLFWARRNIGRMTQIELREKMEGEYGVSIGANYISEIETGRGDKKPSFEVIRAMAGALGVSLDFLARFTDNWMPAQNRESAPHYFSDEADQVAQLVDTLYPEQRSLVLNLARSLSASPIQRQRRQAEAKEILDSIEAKWGRERRDEIERIMRDKGMFIDDAS